MLSLPRTVGSHPETGQPVTAGVGLFGPFVAHQGVFASIALKSSGWTPFTVTMDAAMELFAKKAVRVAAREAKGLPAFEKRKTAVKVKTPTSKTRSDPDAAAAVSVTAEPEVKQHRLSKAKLDKDGGSNIKLPVATTASQRKRQLSGKPSTTQAAYLNDVPGNAVKASLVEHKDPVVGRALNPYLQYSALNRQRLKDLNPTAKPTELVSLIAAEWRGLVQSQRDLYATCTEPLQPVARMQAVTNSVSVEGGGEGHVTAKSPTTSNPYLQFNAVNRKRIKEQNPAAKPSEVMSLLAAEWRGLDDGQRALYKTAVASV